MYNTNYALLIIPTKKHYTKTETHASHTHHNIPTTRSNHPLDLSISSDQIQILVSVYKSAFTNPDEIVSLKIIPQSPI